MLPLIVHVRYLGSDRTYWRDRLASLQDFIFECQPFGIVLLEPFILGFRRGENLEMVDVSDLAA